MTRLKAVWARVKWPLVWALVPLLLYVAGGRAVTLYQEHRAMVRWINAADPYVAQLQKTQKAAPKPTSTAGPE